MFRVRGGFSSFGVFALLWASAFARWRQDRLFPYWHVDVEKTMLTPATLPAASAQPRTSSRTKCAPLEFWKGERPIYAASPTGLTLQGIIRNPSSDAAALPTSTQKARVASRPAQRGANPEKASKKEVVDIFAFRDDSALPPKPVRPRAPSKPSVDVTPMHVDSDSTAAKDTGPSPISPLAAAGELIASSVAKAASEAKAKAVAQAKAKAEASKAIAAANERKMAAREVQPPLPAASAIPPAPAPAMPPPATKVSAPSTRAPSKLGGILIGARSSEEFSSELGGILIGARSSGAFSSELGAEGGLAVSAAKLERPTALKSAHPVARLSSSSLAFDDAAASQERLMRPLSMEPKAPSAQEAAAAAAAAPKKPKARSMVAAMQATMAQTEKDPFAFDDDDELEVRSRLPPSKRLRKKDPFAFDDDDI